MKGDFSRSTFDPRKHYNSVRMQQGRLQLDADWNEQADILLHLLRIQLNDLLGSGATAATEPGFVITPEDPARKPESLRQAGESHGLVEESRSIPDFKIGKGRYYVDGILCENDNDVLFSQQSDYPEASLELKKSIDGGQYLAYLDVWERHITAFEDPLIRESALMGPDTATRVKTIWQVKLLPLGSEPESVKGVHLNGDLRSLPVWQKLIVPNEKDKKRKLMARWKPGREPEEASRLENCLYRIEIHDVTDSEMTFKWSRDNGSVVFPVTAIDSSPIQGVKESAIRVWVEGIDRDPDRLREDAWVEIVDDITLLNNHPLPLCQVFKVDRMKAFITLQSDKIKINKILENFCGRQWSHPLIRCWGKDVAPVVSSEHDHSPRWLDIENRIQISFDNSGTCQVGDYWLIPARARLNTGIEWPQEESQPVPQAPHGIDHHYAPLALLQFKKGRWTREAEESFIFHSLPELTRKLSEIGRKPDKKFDKKLQELSASVSQIQETLEGMARKSCVFDIVKSEDKLGKGDLVSLDRAEVQRMDPIDTDAELPVRLASSSDGAMVMGVVWKVVEEEKDSKRYMVILQGRGRCKVIGNIEPGDLLMPSEELGYAKKAGLYQQPGTIIGKAVSFTTFEPAVMEEIEEGTRQVEADLENQPGSVEAIITLG